MKRKSIITLILSAALIISSLFVPSAFAALYGDIDQDGIITASDARLALRASVNINDNLSALQRLLADVDFDGSILSSDARLILRASVNLEELCSTHEHSYSEWQVETDRNGKDKGTHFRICECNAYESVKHSYINRTVLTQPSCSATGSAYSVCSVCNAGYDEVIPKLEHTLTNYTVETAASCTQEGSAYYVCSVCNEKVYEALELIEHNYINYTLETAATCTQTGRAYSSCSMCGERRYEEIPLASHSFGAWQAEINASGEKTGNHYKVCGVCGTTDSSRVNFFNELVNPLKSETNRFSSVSMSKTVCEPSATGIFTTLMDINELRENSTQWDPFSLNRALTKDNFPIFSNDLVSLLSSEDEPNVTASYVNGIDFIRAFPDTVTSNNIITHDFRKLKNTSIGNVLKFEITLSETFSEDPAFNANSVMNKIYGSEYNEFLTEMLASMEMSGGDEYDNIMSSSKSAKTLFTLSFYFDADSFEPLAAKYNIKTDILFVMDLFNLPGFLANKLTLDTDIELDTCYFFNNNFEIV